MAILFLQKFHVLALVVFIASVLAKASFDTSIQEALSRIVGGRVETVLLIFEVSSLFVNTKNTSNKKDGRNSSTHDSAQSLLN